MRAIKRKRPRIRQLSTGVLPHELADIARQVSYVGSVEHKASPSFAGWPRPRADASICDQALSGDRKRLTDWLRVAIERGHVGEPWEGAFPRYVWYHDAETMYEARLVNRSKGEYKGYPLRKNEWPRLVKNVEV
jgi:hypothetical protein